MDRNELIKKALEDIETAEDGATPWDGQTAWSLTAIARLLAAQMIEAAPATPPALKSDDDYLPCPFCGSEALGVERDTNGAYVYCSGCTTRGPHAFLGNHREYVPDAEAWAKWNKRDYSPSIETHLQQLEQR